MKHLIYIYFSLVVLCTGCNYLDTVPENDIETIETIFEKKENAEDWLQSCYVFLVDEYRDLALNPATTGTDEVVANEYVRQYMMKNGWGGTQEWAGFSIADGLQMAQEPYGNLWKRDGFYAGIRYCNIFIDKIGQVYNMENDEKDLWTAEIKALKAHFYFELMRRYGSIVLVPQNIDANAEIAMMQQPRAPIDSVVSAIVTLLDEAIEVLPAMNQKASSRRGYHCKESAAALKAMTLLYAASPLFNGNPAYTSFTNKKGEKLFPATYDAEKWKKAAEAADDAIEIALQGGKKLAAGNATQSTKLLNTMMDIEKSVSASNFKSDEALLIFAPSNTHTEFWWAWTLPFVDSDDWPYYCQNAFSGIAPSMKMVERYYTENGLPIEEDKVWDYTSRYRMGNETNPQYKNVVSLNANDVLGLHLRREPRFYAHIAADRCYWQRGTYISDDMIAKCRQGERYGTKISTINSSTPQNLTGYYMKKFTYTEVTNTDYYSTVMGRDEANIIIRLADLYLMKAEAWNEYLAAPDVEHVYAPLDEVRKRAGIPGVVDAWTAYAKNPNKVNTKEGMRAIIRQEWDIEFAFEGRRFWNLRRWLTAADELNVKQYGWNVLGKTAQQFYNNFEGPIVVWNKRKFVAPRDYLFPIRSEEVLISGCKQNPGW